VKRTFHHIGLPALDQATPIPGESWVEENRCWVTDPLDHPQRIEWLRYAPDSPVDPAFQQSPHICYIIDSLDEAIDGREIVLAPFEPGDPPFGRAAFVWEDGVVVEYIQLYTGREWFNDTT
jgi:hypothetical protein